LGKSNVPRREVLTVKLRSQSQAILLYVLLLAAAYSTARAQDTPESSSNPEYVLGVEDRLSISVWKEPDLSRIVAIRPDGKITSPLVGDIQAAGRTAKQLSADLTIALSRFVKEPVVNVTVEAIESFKVFVLGEVSTQGALVLRRRTRLLEAIALSGGMTQYANRSDVVLIRYDDNKESRQRIDYRKIVSGEKSELNIFLRPGDTIIVN
jgi:polysaccharide export outer membrane protein